ncbi:DUF4145 domain-containing protein [Kitasatospora sp. NPDC101801]|uniref:DUF4145 domain-containing protein n=1 Tax=Kitasatospora sp. NPDC101801 TaxID=3364103 RepID=UPI0038248016
MNSATSHPPNTKPTTTSTTQICRSQPHSEVSNEPGAVQLEWTPASAVWVSYEDVPSHIASAASEAHACLSINAYRGAVALARAVVEATAKDKRIVNGTLVAKIDALAEQGHIRPITKEAAHEVRHGGNEVAHGDLAGEPLSEDDAASIVTLMDEILNEVYQGPAKMERLKAQRLARKQANQAGSLTQTAPGPESGSP